VTVVGEAVVRVRPDARGFDQELENEVEKPVASTAGKITALLGGAFALSKAKDFFVDAIGAASDLGESASKVDVVFGDAAGSVRAFAEDAAEGIGQSENQALEAVGTFGNLLRSLQLSEGQAADMSTTMVQLASDLASFNNANPAEVLEALRSGLAGETEPLRRFGVSLSAARIEAEGMARGINKSYQEMSAAERSALAYEIILEDTALAQGDFARTADGAANRQRILAASFRDLAADLGSRLLPIGIRVLDFAQGLTGWLERMPNGVQGAAFAIAGLAAAAGPLMYVLSGVTAALGALLSPVGLVVAGVAALAAGLVYLWRTNEDFRAGVQVLGEFLTGTVLPQVQSFIAGLLEGWQQIAPVVQEVIAVVTAVVGEVVTFIGEKFSEILAWTQRVWPQVQEAISHVLNVIEGIVRTVTEAIRAVWQVWGDDLLRIVQSIWQQIQAVIDGAIRVIQGVIQTVLAIINGDWSRAWEGIKTALSGVWDAMKGVVSGAIGTIQGVIGGALDTISSAWSGTWDAAKDKFGEVWDWILDKFRTVLDGIKSAWNAVAGVLNGITFTFDGIDMPGPIPDVPGFTVDPIRDLPTFAKGVRNFGGGLALVGERGPELVNLPRGADVFSNRESRQILGAASGPTVTFGDIHIHGGGDPAEVRRQLDQWADELVRELRSA